MRKPILIVGAGLLFVIIFGLVITKYSRSNKNTFTKSASSSADSSDEEAPPPAPVSATDQEIRGTPGDTSGLGGYNVLIADRGNNRLIEVTPDKKIVWEYHFDLPELGLGADDAFFTDSGKIVIVNLEEYHVIQMIDYASKQVIWSYGTPGQPGSKEGQLNTPDDAYKLPNGDVIVADIKNCRVIEITPNKKIIHQYGKTKECSNKPGYLNKPNGDTPLPNGHILISDIVGKNLVELDQNWQQTFTMPLPVSYPSDPQLTKAGNILISDYSKPGQIVETSKQGQIVWQFSGQEGDVKLNQPSLAIELPNGNILSNDDSNHRVIVIDKQSKKIVWQYGVTGKPGNGPGQLSVPDGVDIIKRDATTSSSSSSLTNIPSVTIGSITRHTQGRVDQFVTVSGYVLEQDNGYAIFSDESSGSLSVYDLPVTGPRIDAIKPNQKYILKGIFKHKGLNASNHNQYHLELTSPPQAVNQ